MRIPTVDPIPVSRSALADPVGSKTKDEYPGGWVVKKPGDDTKLPQGLALGAMFSSLLFNSRKALAAS